MRLKTSNVDLEMNIEIHNMAILLIKHMSYLQKNNTIRNDNAQSPNVRLI